MPRIHVQTSPDNEVHLEWRNEKKEAMLSCDRSFELHDDVTVLEFMRMAQVENEAELRQVLSNCPDIANLLLERVPSLLRSQRSERDGESASDNAAAGSAGGAVVKTEPADWKEGGSK